MPLDVQIVSPNAATTLTLKAERVTMDIIRTVTAEPIPPNEVVGVDLRFARRVFTITGKITIEGATTAKTQLESLEDATLNWASQGAGGDSGQTTFKWGTKNDATAKDYKVFITRLNVIDPAEEVGGKGEIYYFLLQLTEVGVMSTSG